MTKLRILYEIAARSFTSDSLTNSRTQGASRYRTPVNHRALI